MASRIRGLPRITRQLRDCLSSEDAQAYTEYLIVFLFIIAALVGTTALFQAVLAKYLKRIFYVVSLPVP